MKASSAGSFVGQPAGSIGGPLVLAVILLSTTAAASETTAGLLSIGTDVPVSYAQLAAGGGVPRTRVEAIPGIALGEGSPGVALGAGALGEPQAAAPGLSFRTWGSGFGFSSRTGADIRGAGFKTRGGGVSVGADRFFTPTFLAGVAFSFSRSETSSVGVSSDADTLSGATYLFWAPAPGVEVEGLLGVDRAEIETRRILGFGGIASQTRGKTDALGLTAVGNVGYRFRSAFAGGETYFKPFAGLSYTTQDRDGFSEFGPLGVGLSFPSKTFERATVNLGAATGVDLAAGNGWVVRPELRVAWSRFLSDPSSPVPAFRDGTFLLLRDPKPGQDGAVVALELTGTNAGVQLFAGYAGEIERDRPSGARRVAIDLVKGGEPPAFRG